MNSPVLNHHINPKQSQKTTYFHTHTMNNKLSCDDPDTKSGENLPNTENDIEPSCPFRNEIFEMATEYWVFWNYNSHNHNQSDEWLDNDDFNENNNVYVSQIDVSLILPPWAGVDVFQEALPKDGSLVTGTFVNGTFIPEYERYTP